MKNIAMILRYAYGLEMVKALPESLEEPQKRINLLRGVDRFILPRMEELTPSYRPDSNIGPESSPFIPDENDPERRTNIALRLWAGYILTAFGITAPNTKIIADKDRREAIESAYREWRNHHFPLVEFLCDMDPIIKAGSEIAQSYKEQLGELTSLDGVPAGATIKQFVDVQNWIKSEAK